MTLDEQKKTARAAAFARRKTAFQTQSAGACGVLSEILAGYRGVPTAGFMPINTEIDPRPAMDEASAHGLVGIPVIEAAATPLKFAQWAPDIPLVEGAFKAQIPEHIEWMIPEIVIVPLVAFDRQGGRIGYGGGFYDRTLEGLRARGPVLAIGFAFTAQEAENLPLEPTDQPLNMIITETGVITPSPASS
ncbi:MAG: 5-formyltetrahydrofolate cyclo-ligase [Planktomarina sp.]